MFAMCQTAFAQNQTQAAGKTATKKGKASKESCDGALDIVPAKAMTFVRKRRPANSDQPKPAEAKSEKRQSGEISQSK